MKLLLDHNLSFRIVGLVADLFPESLALRDVELQRADDETVWKFAADNELLVSKDSDFRQRSLLRGFPPKVISVAAGNCSTEHIASLLRRRCERIARFAADATSALLII